MNLKEKRLVYIKASQVVISGRRNQFYQCIYACLSEHPHLHTADSDSEGLSDSLTNQGAILLRFHMNFLNRNFLIKSLQWGSFTKFLSTDVAVVP